MYHSTCSMLKNGSNELKIGGEKLNRCLTECHHGAAIESLNQLQSTHLLIVQECKSAVNTREKEGEKEEEEEEEEEESDKVTINQS